MLHIITRIRINYYFPYWPMYIYKVKIHSPLQLQSLLKKIPILTIYWHLMNMLYTTVEQNKNKWNTSACAPIPCHCYLRSSLQIFSIQYKVTTLTITYSNFNCITEHRPLCCYHCTMFNSIRLKPSDKRKEEDVR